jgi:signal transduction histidine kinase
MSLPNRVPVMRWIESPLATSHAIDERKAPMSRRDSSSHRIEVVRKFEPVPLVLVDRHVVLQILINLVNNARDALDSRDGERLITLRICHGEGARVRVEVSDNGEGIPTQNLARIFNHGFTTKKTGHGFGLHSGANAAKQLGGALNVHSDGPGTGATFILELPVTQHSTPGSTATSDRHLSHAA